MALPKARILNLIENNKLTIEPFEEASLNAYGYNVHIGTKVMLAEREDGTNVTIDTAKAPTYTTYDIPDSGFVLDPTKSYYLPLKETIKTDEYSIELVTNSTLVQSGLVIGLSATPIPGAEVSTTISVSTDQPLKIYKNYCIANARFTLTDDGGGSISGMIVAYSGSEVPYGWLLCDGTNGTPDLRNRFIMGARASDVGKTGGEASSQLTIENLPSINKASASAVAAAMLLADETAGGDPGTATVEALAPFTDYLQMEAKQAAGNSTEADPSNELYDIPMYKSGEKHTVNITTGSSGGSITGGNDEPFTNLPPYYALMYIMKK